MKKQQVAVLTSNNAQKNIVMKHININSHYHLIGL